VHARESEAREARETTRRFTERGTLHRRAAPG
jgi:hypothetical protein